MAVSKEYRAEVERTISEVRPITSRAMFGGVALYADGLIFAILDNDRLWFKVDAENQPDYEARGMEQWVYAPGAPPMGYFELPVDVLASPAYLAVWIDRSIAVAERKAAAKRGKKKK